MILRDFYVEKVRGGPHRICLACGKPMAVGDTYSLWKHRSNVRGKHVDCKDPQRVPTEADGYRRAPFD